MPAAHAQDARLDLMQPSYHVAAKSTPGELNFSSSGKKRVTPVSGARRKFQHLELVPGGRFQEVTWSVPAPGVSFPSGVVVGHDVRKHSENTTHGSLTLRPERAHAAWETAGCRSPSNARRVHARHAIVATRPPRSAGGHSLPPSRPGHHPGEVESPCLPAPPHRAWGAGTRTRSESRISFSPPLTIEATTGTP